MREGARARYRGFQGHEWGCVTQFVMLPFPAVRDVVVEDVAEFEEDMDLRFARGVKVKPIVSFVPLQPFEGRDENDYSMICSKPSKWKVAKKDTLWSLLSGSEVSVD